jgi:hypothetical protein
MRPAMPSRSKLGQVFLLVAISMLVGGCGDECNPTTYGQQCVENSVTTCQIETGLYTSSVHVESHSCGERICSTWFGEKEALCLPAQTEPTSCALETVFNRGYDSENSPSVTGIEWVNAVGMVDDELTFMTDREQNLRFYRASSLDEPYATTPRVNVGVSEYVVGDAHHDGVVDVVVRYLIKSAG